MLGDLLLVAGVMDPRDHPGTTLLPPKSAQKLDEVCTEPLRVGAFPLSKEKNRRVTGVGLGRIR